MTYPPQWRQNEDAAAALELMRSHPFAHLFTAHGGLAATRIPFIAEVEDGDPKRLRAHLNAQNPQVQGLDGAPVLIVFSGPSTYVSPHWRASKTRAGTYDYEEVRVHGVARAGGDIAAFRRLIDDLSAMIEPQYADIGGDPVWQTHMAPDGYVERLFPHIVLFTVHVARVETISKLHQQFPEEDRRSIADRLSRSRRDDSRAIAGKIRRTLPR
jgi:transcriptional regulator